MSIQAEIIFVIGAGASNELGLPIGSILKEKISNALNFNVPSGRFLPTSGDSDLYEAIKLINNSELRLLTAARQIKEGLVLSPSIDNYIHSHNNEAIEICGKLAIVSQILKAEKESNLYFDKHEKDMPDFKGIEYTWYNWLFKRITENCRIDDLETRLSSVCFIIFNYDRCLEEYLYHSFLHFYNISPQAAADLISKIRIYHPYGKVGMCKWQNSNGHSFGEPPNRDNLLKLKDGIKTFTEGTDPTSSDITEIRELMQSTPRIIFLGFAFASQNLDLLCPKTSPNKEPMLRKFVGGTGFGLSDHNRNLVIEDIRNRLHINNLSNGAIDPNKGQIHIAPYKCLEFFENYERSLSFEF